MGTSFALNLPIAFSVEGPEGPQYNYNMDILGLPDGKSSFSSEKLEKYRYEPFASEYFGWSNIELRVSTLVGQILNNFSDTFGIML